MSMEAREALRQLAYDYAACVDGLDAEALIMLFTEDGVVGSIDRSVPAFEGPDKLRRMVAQVDEAFVKTMHNVHNHSFDHIGEAEASGETTCIASHIVEGEDGSWQVFDMALRYANRYRKVGGAWRFAERRLDCQWTETRPCEPFDPAGLAYREGEN
ncbi:MAG: nuclear transport factor 2 family protein [Pseudomonadota bacterium]